MKYLILADIHSNLEALKACLKDAGKQYKRILCLGDIVGYGANPNECIELLRRKKAICLMGNHDAATVGLLQRNWFNEAARTAIEWTEQELTEENKAFLRELPEFFSCQFLLAVHGSPRSPLREYMDGKTAEQALRFVMEDLVLCGHTHIPFKFEERKGIRMLYGNNKIEFNEKRMVLSMPSVGQPRDRNPRAGYGLLDFDKKSIEIKRINYDVESASKKILSAGLPEFLATRLKKGI